jgi:hypothetical protein
VGEKTPSFSSCWASHASLPGLKAQECAQSTWFNMTTHDMTRLHFLASSVRAVLRELTGSADDVSGSYIITATALVSIVATFFSDHYLITMAELPKTYKACVYDQPGKISTKVVSLDVPEPGPGEVLVKLSVSCGRKALYPPILTDLTAAHTQAYAILTSAS